MTIHSRWAMALLLFGMVASIAPRSAKAAEGPWRWSNPRPHGNSIRAIAKGEDFSIEVGDNGSIHTSQNMVQWFPRESGVEHTLRATVFFNEQAIVAGDDGILLYSESEEQFEPGKLDKPASGELSRPGGLERNDRCRRRRRHALYQHRRTEVAQANLWVQQPHSRADLDGKLFRRCGRGRSCGHQHQRQFVDQAPEPNQPRPQRAGLRQQTSLDGRQ